MNAFSRFRPHPWHGVSLGPQPPARVHAFVEITPLSTLKYEVDKETGFLAVDRPQRTSALPPGAYGFVPRTTCAGRVAALAGVARGDGDPLDICIVSERVIDAADILLKARVVGGLRMVDRGEADDKILAVIEGDAIWGEVADLAALPPAIVERWRHYFATYKLRADGTGPVQVDAVYGREHAEGVVLAAAADYDDAFGSSAAQAPG